MQYCSMDSFSWLCILLIALLLQILGSTAVPVPNSNCYSLDNSSRLVDFSSLIGHAFVHEAKDNTDLVVRFCKDVETRSQTGYIDFGRFSKPGSFHTGSGQVDFVQDFYNGDLVNCENSYDKLGRTAQVNLLCGGCLNGACQGGLGCICNFTYESTCRVVIDLAIPCEKPGPRVFQGFTVGFHPRSWEIVYDGLTQPGFEKPHQDFSLGTEQNVVTLYMTAIASLSALVKKPMIEVHPRKGLEVVLSGSGASGTPPTTLSPSMLILEWECQKGRIIPYEVNVTIPIDGYSPIQFFLTKMCEHRQDEEENTTRGWVIFGILSCIFFVGATLFCCAGFIYKTRVERLHGIDALPGMTILSACLEAVSGMGHGYSYSRTEEVHGGYTSDASWDRHSVSGSAAASSSTPTRGSSRSGNVRYGSI
ncbi:unnamed protein product [Linum trigynum]|uniref:AT4G36440-like protein n=1 Tax=Linum trigynum TaxID=586398 RepID=A0AAV2CWL4_9ROSI